MARRFFSRKRMGLAVLPLVLVAAALLLAPAVLRLMGAQAGSAVEVISGTALHAGPLAPAVRDLPAAQAGAGIPRATLSSDFHNFGAIGAQDVVRKDFLILNRGDAPLRLERAYTTCGCTTAEISAGVIPPGKAARITLTFDAGFHPVSGQTVRRGLILETNDPARPQMEIWVQAAVGK